MKALALLCGLLGLGGCAHVITEEVYYDDPPLEPGKLSVFLAGPSSHVKWRPDAVRLLRDGGFKGSIVIPEFRSGVFDKKRWDDGKPSTVPKMTRASERVMQWETDGIDNATVLVVWMPYTGFDDSRQWTGLQHAGRVVAWHCDSSQGIGTGDAGQCVPVGSGPIPCAPTGNHD